MDTRITRHQGDVLDLSGLKEVVFRVRSDEIYHLAGQSHVPTSFTMPNSTINVVSMGTHNLLQVAVELMRHKQVKFLNVFRVQINKNSGRTELLMMLQACSSEIFGRVRQTPQTEETPFQPLSPYAISKATSFWMVSNMREIHNMYAVNTISFNHESPRRSLFIFVAFLSCLP